VRKLICLLVAVVGTVCAYGQNKKGNFYLTWGYHTDRYTKSTIHFKDETHSNARDNYNFELIKVTAHDRQDMHDLFRTAISIPQYVLNIGYFFAEKPKWGIELSWDHLKYIVTDGQTFHMKGTYNGMYHDVDTTFSPNWIHYEHTNGNNYLMASAVRKFQFFENTKVGTHLSLLVKAGAGGLVPKTDSRIFGLHNDGPFRLSGFVIGASTAVRYTLFKYLYVEGSVKGAFADYTNAKVYEQGRAKHTFFSVQYIYAAGFNIPI